MELKQVGEFGLIDLLKDNTIFDSSSVVVGIGDDAAVTLPTPRQLQLLTADMLVEGVHFALETTAPWQLGYKAVAVNLSDIAAMGGTPKHAVISIAVPKHTQLDFLTNLYDGMKEICREFGVNIIGGDTVSSPQGLVINVTVAGEVEPTNLVRRSGAQIGDIVVVTGPIGNSAAGFDLLTKGNWEDYDFAWPLVTAHLTPRPQVKAGRVLAEYGATSMDDISDGLASEANEIASASGIGLIIRAADIPLSPEMIQAAGLFEKQAIDYALYGGEDFQLLFTIKPDQYRLLANQDIGVQLTAIGEVVEKAAGVVLIDRNGNRTALEPRGYNHFR
ncbi:Thiamine-monophosphate kinase [bioreactor metagenome]|uniref:Thiamine-monophosphate kinase n=1 Tax=bioreactor metagenome TaxID=1076179 RepID=A0A644TFS7_9ZZZZ|nr:thiamine-phosphate kinase [Negativicutes bacterium]